VALPDEVTPGKSPQEITVPTAAGMRALGQRLAALLRAGDLLLLTGPLGAGKTTLVQGLGEALRVRGPVTSPTFVIARVHPSLTGGPALVHVDAYRLGGLAEMDDLDLDLDGSVTVVEWGEGLAEGLSADRLEITIGFVPRGPAAGGPAPGGPAPSDPAPGGPAPGGPAPGGPAPDGPDQRDEPRLVRISGIGARWASAGRAAKPAG
jgi:tRNA threonylcarbamoyladenosine biosynthesis protein TsaE